MPVASRVNLRSKDQNTEKQSLFLLCCLVGERIPERPLLGKIAFENRALKDTWSSHVMCVTPKKKMRNWNPPNFIVVQKSGKLLTTKLSGPFSPTGNVLSTKYVTKKTGHACACLLNASETRIVFFYNSQHIPARKKKLKIHIFSHLRDQFTYFLTSGQILGEIRSNRGSANLRQERGILQNSSKNRSTVFKTH